jgi:hypothetical protein
VIGVVEVAARFSGHICSLEETASVGELRPSGGFVSFLRDGTLVNLPPRQPFQTRFFREWPISAYNCTHTAGTGVFIPATHYSDIEYREAVLRIAKELQESYSLVRWRSQDLSPASRHNEEGS